MHALRFYVSVCVFSVMCVCACVHACVRLPLPLSISVCRGDVYRVRLCSRVVAGGNSSYHTGHRSSPPPGMTRYEC